MEEIKDTQEHVAAENAEEQHEEPQAAEAQAAEKPVAESNEQPAVEAQETKPAVATPAAAAPEAAEPASYAEVTRALRQCVIDAELRAAAAMEGVGADRIAYVARMCDMSAAMAEGADVASIAKEQVQGVLAAVPEMRGGAKSTGTMGDFKRSPSAAPKKDPSQMTDAEYYESLGK